MRRCFVWLWCSAAVLAGCSGLDPFAVRSQSPDESRSEHPRARLVGDLAVPFGMFPIRVEAVGLVCGLPDTGSDPPPSVQRSALIDEMQRRGVENPNQVLASPSTALVLVQGVLRPGIQKGDHFDIEIRVPARSETTSLRGGRLLETRLKELAVLDNRIREGHLLAMGQGPVMVDPAAEANEDRVLASRGRILGGGIALKSRSLGLVLKARHQNVVNSSRIANALNKRFHTFERGVKVGVAKAKTDEYIELKVHPRYQDNIQRYVRVVRAVALQDSAGQRVERISELRDQLLDPVTAAAVAVQLEAIGTQGVDALLEGIKSKEPEVRFYAAEALAYLDRTEAAEPLGEAARRRPAFRVFALTALSAMDDYAAYEQLRDLLAASSAETRYGAFRALWAMRADDPLVLGEILGGQFSYHVLHVAGPPMVHVTRNRRPEIVLFGQDQRLLLPLAINAGNQIMVTSTDAGEVAVSKYVVGEPDQQRVVSPRLDKVIRAIVELGGTYPDVVQALQEAKAAGALAGRFEVDAVPRAGRAYARALPDEQESDAVLLGGPTTPSPGLFRRNADAATAKTSTPGPESPPRAPERSESPRKRHPVEVFFDRMMGRDPS